MVGDRIRHARVAQQRSLADIAAKADVSVATLSRVENNKQALDLELFLLLARILKVGAADLLGDEAEAKDEPLAQKLASLPATDRTRFWRDLAAAKRRGMENSRSGEKVAAQVEELLAQVEFLRAEIETVRKRLGRETKRRARA